MTEREAAFAVRDLLTEYAKDLRGEKHSTRERLRAIYAGILEVRTQAGKPMDEGIARDLAKLMKDATLKQGRRPDHRRNEVIVHAVQVAHYAGGLPYYASGGATRTTCCQLVAKLLQEYGIFLSDDQVKTIWKNG